MTYLLVHKKFDKVHGQLMQIILIGILKHAKIKINRLLASVIANEKILADGTKIRIDRLIKQNLIFFVSRINLRLERLIYYIFCLQFL